MKKRPAEKLIVALDVPGLKEAEKLVKKLSPLVKIFKIGKELFTAAGPEAVRMVHARECRVFLDLKFHDIPNTVGAACAAAARLGVFMLNVHALGGPAMMRKAAESVRTASAGKKTARPLLVGVTVLTSVTGEDLKQVGISKSLENEVDDLAFLAKASGLDGVVASGLEIRRIRRLTGKNFLIVTPGVRPAWAQKGDQERTVTPREAIRGGADFIVMGRPITAHPKPGEAARAVLSEMQENP